MKFMLRGAQSIKGDTGPLRNCDIASGRQEERI